MTAYSICPFCGERIDLHEMKDFESYSNIETLRHYEEDHPEVLTDFGMPYTPIRFDDE